MRVDTLADRHAVTLPGCMMCGRSIDAEKAARNGGSRRFCSERCLAYFDAGWQPDRGAKWMPAASRSTPASCLPKSASGRSISEAAKHRERVKRKKAFAESWKKHLARQRSAGEAKP
jgi:hypothetical protein